MANAKTTTNPSVISEASKTLGKPVTNLRKLLLLIGVKDDEAGYKLLKARTTTESYLADVIRGKYSDVPELKILAAASILKGINPFEEEPKEKTEEKAQEEVKPDTAATLILEAAQINRTPAQMKDRELLELYAKEREYEIEQELHKRAKFKRFIVLVPGKYEPGKEIIDLDKSIDLLKKARKMEIPQIASFDGKILQVHRITELNSEDRKTELCPVCGKAMFQGYCQDCGLDFGGVGMDERAYVNLISKSTKFDADSFSDRRAVHASATKGLDDLRQTWPSISPEFDDLQVSNNLPRLVIMKPVLCEKKMDPFHRDGNRTY